MSGERALRIQELERVGARGLEIKELLAYNANPFDVSSLDGALELPLPDEEFVPVWREWARLANKQDEKQTEGGAFAVLRRFLPELAFPIVEGVSHWPSYRQATLHGTPIANLPGATGLVVQDPASIELELSSSLAGAVPVITVRDRATFITLARALARRNEPEPIPDALGGLMITGYSNWHRLREKYGAGFAERSAGDLGDRFMLLSDGPYSAVPASRLGLEAAEWRRLSLDLRRAHEEVHYLMRRLLGAMRNNLFDELIAEFVGMRQAWGYFRPDWLRLFLGLEEKRGLRPGGRLDVYRGDPPLSRGAFEALGILIRRAIETLDAFDRRIEAGSLERFSLAAVVGALASQPLEVLASPRGLDSLLEAYGRLELLLKPDMALNRRRSRVSSDTAAQ